MRVFASTFVLLVYLALAVHAEPAAPAPSSSLDHASLKAMLEEIGYAPIEKKYSGTDTSFWQVPITRGPWRYDVAVSAYTRDVVYVSVEFGLYGGRKEDIPQSILLAMLSENYNLTWSHFVYLTQSEKFALIAAIHNADVTGDHLRRVIDEIVDAADRTQNLWVPDQWPKPPAAQPEAAAGTAQ